MEKLVYHTGQTFNTNDEQVRNQILLLQLFKLQILHYIISHLACECSQPWQGSQRGTWLGLAAAFRPEKTTSYALAEFIFLYKERNNYRITHLYNILMKYLTRHLLYNCRWRNRATQEGVTKRCRLSWLTNSVLVYEPKCGGRGGIAGSQPISTAVHRSPNKLWRSNSIFNLWGITFRKKRLEYWPCPSPWRASSRPQWRCCSRLPGSRPPPSCLPSRGIISH